MGWITFGYAEDGLISPFSFFHCMYGVVTSLIALKYWPRWYRAVIFFLAVHMMFEMWESSPNGLVFWEWIAQYEMRIWISWPTFRGDSVLNSQADNICMLIGWHVPRWIHGKWFSGKKEQEEKEVIVRKGPIRYVPYRPET